MVKVRQGLLMALMGALLTLGAGVANAGETPQRVTGVIIVTDVCYGYRTETPEYGTMWFGGEVRAPVAINYRYSELVSAADGRKVPLAPGPAYLWLPGQEDVLKVDWLGITPLADLGGTCFVTF